MVVGVGICTIYDRSLLVLQYFQREVPGQFGSEPDALMHMAYNVKYNSKKMKKLEKDYTVMKTKEQEDLIELRVSMGERFEWEH